MTRYPYEISLAIMVVKKALLKYVANVEDERENFLFV